MAKKRKQKDEKKKEQLLLDRCAAVNTILNTFQKTAGTLLGNRVSNLFVCKDCKSPMVLAYYSLGSIAVCPVCHKLEAVGIFDGKVSFDKDSDNDGEVIE